MRNKYITPHLTIPHRLHSETHTCHPKLISSPDNMCIPCADGEGVRWVHWVSVSGSWAWSKAQSISSLAQPPSLEPARYPPGLWMAAFPTRWKRGWIPKSIRINSALGSGDFPHSCFESIQLCVRGTAMAVLRSACQEIFQISRAHFRCEITLTCPQQCAR